MAKKSGLFILTVILVLAVLAGCQPRPTPPPGAPPPPPVPAPAPVPSPTPSPKPSSPGEDNNAADILSQVAQIPQLNFDLAEFIGKKVWAWGYYGDGRFSEMGVGFLVLNYNSLLVDERMEAEDFIRLDGKLPPADVNSTEMLVYGEVKDFGQTYGAFTMQPTPLLTVEQYYVLDDTGGVRPWQDSLILTWWFGIRDFFAGGPAYAQDAAGTRAGDCDRSLIISGGVDDNNNHPRYKDNIIAKYQKMKELGFSDDHISVLYNNGGGINVSGDNITDGSAAKAKIKETLDKYKDEMNPSCTLTIFVTDHGTGYNADQGYRGARPALAGESETGKTYAENTFKLEIKKKVYRWLTWTNGAGTEWWVRINKQTNRLELLKREGGNWVLKGNDANGNGRITEAETGQDIDGDGDTDEVGWDEAGLGAWQYRDNTWDTDGDGNDDVRARWDGTRYVFERKVGADWKEMGRDTNGDFVIDGTDGGVDWNLDGDKGDQVGFHEGINLWGSEVLWDDELADMLKPLSDKGIHIVVEMVSCFSSGFANNLTGIVEGIGTGSGEDTKHWNRVDATGKVYAADEKAFLENLRGIDVDSWMQAWEKAKEADKAAWVAGGSNAVSQNDPQQWSKPLIESQSTFFEVDGDYIVRVKLPDSLAGKVYDMEVYFGLQKPRWTGGGDFYDWPDGMTTEDIPGGVKVTSQNPFPADELTFRMKGAKNAESMRLHITDKDHKNLGYISPKLTETARVTASLEEDAKALGELFGSTDGAAGTERDTSDPVDFTIGTLVIFIDNGIGGPSAEELLAFMNQAFIIDQEAIAGLFTENYQTAYQIEQIVRVATLNMPIDMSAQSVSDGSSCTSTITISYSATLTGGEGLLTIASVVLKVNGQVWANSGSLETDDYHNVVSRQVACGETFSAEVTATSSHGDASTSAASLTTPVP